MDGNVYAVLSDEIGRNALLELLELGIQVLHWCCPPEMAMWMSRGNAPWLPKPAPASLRFRPTGGGSAALGSFPPTPTPVAAGLRKPRAGFDHWLLVASLPRHDCIGQRRASDFEMHFPSIQRVPARRPTDRVALLPESAASPSPRNGARGYVLGYAAGRETSHVTGYTSHVRRQYPDV